MSAPLCGTMSGAATRRAALHPASAAEPGGRADASGPSDEAESCGQADGTRPNLGLELEVPEAAPSDELEGAAAAGGARRAARALRRVARLAASAVASIAAASTISHHGRRLPPSVA
eukprot:scaffold19606_cov84-Isochrysis_galbana.AAC.6